MRQQFVDFMKNLPLRFDYVNIKNYPLSWDDAIRIVYVLSGSLKLELNNETYNLKEGFVEIINCGEIYQFQADEENRVLILSIDPVFFERYYDDARNVLFYTDIRDDMDSEIYRSLKRQIGILLYETFKKFDGYEDKIQENLLDLMYQLLNNFHYLYYEDEGLQDDEEELERYHRISKYLSNNYMNKVSLQEIAEKEFLSSPYLSFKIKDTFGQGFNDYLNEIRCEESVKLLLDSDKSITDIAEEVGFSHSRYYNKNFKLIYGMTPVQYRKKNKVSEKTLMSMKKFEKKTITEAIEILTPLIDDYERFDYDNRIVKIELDLAKKASGKFERPLIIDIGDTYSLLEEENRRMLEQIQADMSLKYCIIRDLFSEDMDIYKGANKIFINWTRVENILEFIFELELDPIIITKNVEKSVIEDFIENFESTYEEITKFLYEDIEHLKLKCGEDINPYYDRTEIVPFILYSCIEEKKSFLMNIVDEINRDTRLDNDTFFGGRGIYTNNYLKKPSYYANELLSMMGEDVIEKGEGYLITSNEEGWQIMLYNPHDLDNIEDRLKTRVLEKRVSLNLVNADSDLQVIKYSLDKKRGSIYEKWEKLNAPERLDNDNWELLEKYVHPSVDFLFLKKQVVQNIVSLVEPYGTVVYILKPVDEE